MINFKTQIFKELPNDYLYDIIALRNEIFVVEQDCVYQDADGKDKVAYHVIGFKNNKVVAVARILPPGISYEEPSIGRVAVSMEHRKNGIGKILMETCISKCIELFPNQNIVISAQEYLEKFYNELGFIKTSKTYLEDGIPHIKMKYKV